MKLQRIKEWPAIPVALSLLFFVLGMVFIILSRHGPLRDFGNYYYGSRMLLDGKFNADLYSGLSYFNQQVATYGERGFFGNYAPVPPFTALLYVPFCFLDAFDAKLLFNALSLVLFCYSLFRLVALEGGNISKKTFLLPLVFTYPLLNNIVQGQPYLLIVALLIEAFVLSQKGKILPPAVCLALSVSLKVFPALVLFFFLFSKRYRIFFASILVFLVLQLITLCFIDAGPLLNYFTTVLPRLFNNDVVGTYYSGNQSIYTALLGLFSYDGLQNPAPIVNSPLLVAAIDGLLTALILFSAAQAARKNHLLGYSVFLFACILLSRYNSSYSLLILLPLGIHICLRHGTREAWTLLVLLCVAMSLPVSQFVESPFVLKYSRLLALLLLLWAVIRLHNFTFNVRYFLAAFLILVVFRYLTFPIKPCQYFEIQNSRGVLYDVEIEDGFVKLKSTLGASDLVEKIPVKGKAVFLPTLYVEDKHIFYGHEELCGGTDNKRKPFLYNDSFVVFMSDLNQGVGMYKLRVVPFRAAWRTKSETNNH